MENGNFLSSSENPRGLGYKTMANDVAVHKPLTPILDRFKAMLKEREDEIRVSISGGGEGLPPSTDEIVRLYEVVLSELTFNSKPIITDLTIIAGEQREHGEGIADAICARIIKVPVEQKLPALYLLDSIVKNIGKEYVRHFSVRLPEVFCSAYRQVHPNLFASMRHLFGTWSAVFPFSVLRKIEAQLQFSPSFGHQSSGLRASESPRPMHGIHVNPKYLEARRQLEHSNIDSVGGQMLNSAGRTSIALESERQLPSSGAKLASSSSHFGVNHAKPLSPAVDEFITDDSPQRIVEKTSSSHPGFGYGFRGAKSTLGNGIEPQGPRALIEAYGTDQRDRSMTHKPPMVRSLKIRGVESKISVQAWKNSEEEEFEWEDMSPTLANRGQNKESFSSFVPASGSSGNTTGIGIHRSGQLDADLRRGGHFSNRFPVITDSLPLPDDEITTTSSERVFSNRITGLHNEPAEIPVSSCGEEAHNWPRSSPWSSQHHINLKGNGTYFPFPATSAVGEQKPPIITSIPSADDPLRLPADIASRMNPRSHNTKNQAGPSASLPSHTGNWRPSMNMMHVSQTHPIRPALPFQTQTRSQFDNMSFRNPVVNPMIDKSLLHQQQFDSSETKATSQLPQLSSQQPRPISFIQQIPPHTTVYPQFSLPQDAQPNLVPSVSHLVPSPQLHDPPLSTVMVNPIPGVQQSILNVVRPPLNLPAIRLPRLPPGPSPPSSQMIPISQNTGLVAPGPPAGGALSGLINSLVAQGLISLAKQAPVQDSMGLEFDLDVLKLRHESVIAALYTNLPRQCTTCGLRFRMQEEHRTHMDWHVTRNRLSRTRKQKSSRKWFVGISMWLSSAEALGNDTVPGFLLPTEIVPENNEDEEIAVPADEDQRECALCGEPFDDFYSDETEEWMYRGAVYLNAPPNGSIVGMDKSQLGPIVHAKCRSESTVVSPEDFGLGDIEESRERKRQRT